MKLDKLMQYGVPHSIIDAWERAQGDKLLPLQSRAVVDNELLKGRSLIICGPTSSGKTFCGEMAAAVNLFKGKKVIFLVPLKAIAEEKYSDFVRKYAEIGIRVAISTRDRQEHDRQIEKGNFDLVIMIYEKFNQLLIRNLDVLNLISLIVVDELQLIGDPARGALLELALIKIKNSGYKPQILGLSAVLRNVDQLALWLECGLLSEKQRPVELLQGVLLGGRFHFKKHNTGEEGSEQLIDLDTEETQEILFANMQKLMDAGEQILVFLKSKRTCEDCAMLFAEQSKAHPSSAAIDALFQLENTTLKDKLMLCFQSGIAFHNADLTFDERTLVEQYYLKGDIRAIFSTSTLSLGINLPARTVFVETQKYEVGDHSGKTVMLPIAWSEYENMSGRAGRLGLQRDFGRSIIIAQNSFQFDYLWEEYVEGREEKIASQLLRKKQEDVILDFAASGLAKTLPQFKQALKSGLGDRFIPHLEETLNKNMGEMERQEILLKKGDCYCPTQLGKLCALKGISVHTGLSIKRKLKQYPNLDPFTWFYCVLNTKDGEDIYINLGLWEQQSQKYEKTLNDRYRNTVPPAEIKELLDRKMTLSPDENRSVKLCCLLSEWIDNVPALDLEQSYLCRSGQIEQIARRVSWLLDAACGLVKVTKSDRKLAHFLKRLSLRVNFGVDESGIQLARLRVSGLGRDYILRLTKAGFCDVRKLREAKIEELQAIIPGQIAQNLKEILEQKSKQKMRKSAPSNRNAHRSREELSLVIDGTPVKDRYLVVINGKKLTLPAKSFKYLVKLVWAAFINEDGWIHKTDFEPGENQTRYLHRLKKQIIPSLEPGQTLMENNRLGCYRLCVSKDKIRINGFSLLKNPDTEIKKMAEEFAS